MAIWIFVGYWKGMSPLWHNLVVHFTGWHSRKIQSLNNHIIIRLMFLLLYHVVIFRTMLPQNKCLLFGFILQKTVWVNPDKIRFYLLPFCGRMITSMNAIYNNENNGTRLCSSFHHRSCRVLDISSPEDLSIYHWYYVHASYMYVQLFSDPSIFIFTMI